MSPAPDSLLVEATDRARRVGISPELMADALRQKRGDRPFVVEVENKTAGSSFFRVTQEGPTRVLYLNQDHPFYGTIYDPPGATRTYRAQIEIFLWVLGTAELDATDENRLIYQQERQRWSTVMGPAAKILDEMLGYPDDRDALAAMDDEEDEFDETPTET